MDIFRKTKTNTLTASEVSALWIQYTGDSMAICVYKYFLNIVENKEIKPILEIALQLAERHVTKITEFLKSANFPIPLGFTENDVNVNAPRLFSDQSLLFYSYIMTIHGLTAYSLAITNSERQDIPCCPYLLWCFIMFQLKIDILVDYSKVFTHAMEAGAFSYNIMVKHGWLEKQPDSD
ncbi:DUF3231 family protein [Bacillus sp. X1(2014)]|uniref:DUF3231 family protein n=1 Tax=Bacillus sp. X1(2014) TaxID=1565991 RepID=UPI0021B17C34|nr:DUF3231 family protein [Bacillus sp. X1(2014)]